MSTGRREQPVLGDPRGSFIAQRLSKLASLMTGAWHSGTWVPVASTDPAEVHSTFASETRSSRHDRAAQVVGFNDSHTTCQTQ